MSTCRDSARVAIYLNSRLVRQDAVILKIPNTFSRPEGPSVPAPVPASQQARPHGADFLKSAQPAVRKRALDDDDELAESSKKSRGEDELEDGVEDVQMFSMETQEDYTPATSEANRGSKRQAGGDDEEANDSVKKKAGSKRARRQSRKTGDSVKPMDEDENGDLLMDLDTVSRGKKRDRAEAGSVFAGDDDSPADNRKKARRRKRKSSLHTMEVDIESRGTKRSYDIESTVDSDDEELFHRAKPSRKRGKRLPDMDDDSTDMSIDGTTVAKDPACGGRKVGEEWQANGQNYKVGPDGRRLRQALVKKRRSRYSMVSRRKLRHCLCYVFTFYHSL